MSRATQRDCSDFTWHWQAQQCDGYCMGQVGCNMNIGAALARRGSGVANCAGWGTIPAE